MSRSYDIAIAGAGPAGLTAALYLKRAGHKVTIFERFDKPKPVGSGLILQPTGLTVLADLDLLDDILSLGSRIERLHRHRCPPPGARCSRSATTRGAAAASASRSTGRRCSVCSIALPWAKRSRSRPMSRSRHWRRLGGRRWSAPRAGGSGRSTSSSMPAARARNCGTISAIPSTLRPLAYGAFWASLGWRDGFDRSALLQRYDKASIMVGVLPIGRPEPGFARHGGFLLEPEAGRCRTGKDGGARSLEGEGDFSVA
ncbi:FAD-dependent oxidoreductase [Mesorhizobium atlanticum]